MSGVQVDISVDCPAWTEALPAAEELARRAATAAVDAVADVLGAGVPLEVSLVLTDDSAVRALNRDWRGQDKPTNVLSFATLDDEDGALPDDAPLLLGDVVLAFETCAAEAADAGRPLADHFAHLVVHGVLHLAGWDHEEGEAEAEEMEARETAILGQLGIADPYRDTIGS